MRIIEALRHSAPGAAPLGALWLLVFAFTGLSAFVIQFVILGWIMPGWSNGAGLLLNTDSVAYHSLAAELAENIQREGWRVWELAPKGQIPIGFYGAIYALALPAPWLAIPLNAAAHACSAILIIQMMRLLVDDWRLAALAAAPYVFFPSASLWYSQLLKDGYTNLSVLLFCYGWMRLALSPPEQGVWRTHLISVALISAGYVITGAARPYTLTLLQLSAIFMAGAILFSLAYDLFKKTITVRRARATLIIVALLPVLLNEARKESVNLGIFTMAEIDVEGRLSAVEKSYWRDSMWLPEVIDQRLATLAGVRKAYLHSGKLSLSVLDKDYEFHNAEDALRFIPRALQIGFLAPFPRQWFEPGSSPATSAMRRISMVEMSIIYGALAFLPFALWRWRRRVEMWVALIFCGSLILIYAMGTPVVGTLYRIRYAYLMLFVALGIAAALSLWRDRRR